jgi:hypothetical protein
MSTKYATILTEPEDNLRIRYIANKHIFQNFNQGASYNSYYLSNIVGITNNDSVLTVYNRWVGVGVTTTSSSDNVFQVNSLAGNTILTVGNNTVGINTSSVLNSPGTFNVYGNTYLQGYVGIGTVNPTERLRVEGNVQAYMFRARGADYAEWEEVDKEEGILPTHGEIIGFTIDGKITTKWSKSIHFGVVSEKPSVLGNEKLLEETESKRYLPIIYMGKIQMYIDQEAAPGDYIIPIQGKTDKISYAIVSPKEITFSQYRVMIGYIHRNVEKQFYECIVRM